MRSCFVLIGQKNYGYIGMDSFSKKFSAMKIIHTVNHAENSNMQKKSAILKLKRKFNMAKKIHFYVLNTPLVVNGTGVLAVRACLKKVPKENLRKDPGIITCHNCLRIYGDAYDIWAPREGSSYLRCSD